MEYGGRAACLFEKYLSVAVIIVSVSNRPWAGGAGLRGIRNHTGGISVCIWDVQGFLGAGNYFLRIKVVRYHSGNAGKMLFAKCVLQDAFRNSWEAGASGTYPKKREDRKKN